MTKLKVRLLCDLHAGDLFMTTDGFGVYKKVRISDGNTYASVDMKTGELIKFPLYTEVVKLSGKLSITGVDTMSVPDTREITLEDILKYFSI